jgi:CheY-like chemotaxis protein
MKTILVIDDNDEIRENTAEMLSLHKYHVITAENGRLGFAAAKAERPDLVLCDMMMPQSDGRDFLHLVKDDKVLQRIPIVFFSAGTASQLITNKLISASRGFIKKPFLEKDLLTTVERVLAE